MMPAKTLLYSVLVGSALAALGCTKAKAHHADHHDEPAASHAGEHDHHGHDHDETSDLDRSPEELFAANCEHSRKAFECDECRYEVGVARVDKSLFEGGLMRTEKLSRHHIEVPVNLTGEVRFDERLVAHVSSQAEGIIRKVMVRLGDRVKRNQPLLEIESLSVGEAEAEYLEAQAMLRLAEQDFERTETLRNEGIASAKEHLQAKQELQAAKIRLASARGKLKRLGGGTPASATNGQTGGRLILRAPSDGTVLSMHAVPGEVARADESMLTVGENSTVWVWADVYERDIAKLAGRNDKLKALVFVRAYPNESFAGTVDFVSPAMDESSRTVKLRVEVPNSDGRLLAGMFAKVQVFIPGVTEALAAPSDAVLQDEGRSFVFVRHHDEYFLRRPVKVGRSWVGRVEILEGLSEGQEIATEGAFLLKSDVLRSKMGAGCAD